MTPISLTREELRKRVEDRFQAMTSRPAMWGDTYNGGVSNGVTEGLMLETLDLYAFIAYEGDSFMGVTPDEGTNTIAQNLYLTMRSNRGYTQNTSLSGIVSLDEGYYTILHELMLETLDKIDQCADADAVGVPQPCDDEES